MAFTLLCALCLPASAPAAAASAPQSSPQSSPQSPPGRGGSDELVDRFQAMQRELDALLQKSRMQDERIRQLEAETGERWLTEQRAEQVRGIVRDVLADSERRASFRTDGVTSGHDQNFFIASPDGNFRLNLEGQIQVRYAYSSAPAESLPSGTEPDSYGFEIRRMQLNFFGNVFDPSVTYRVQLQYQRDASVGAPPLRWADVWMQKALGEGFYVRAGQWKNFFNYEENTSSRTQQMVERSLVNDYFNTKFVQGLLLGWESSHVRTYFSYNDGGANRDVGGIGRFGNLTDWAFTGRLEWMPAGEWGQFRDMQGWIGSPFGAMFGVAVNWQRAGGSPPPERQAVGNGTIIPSSNPATAVADVMTLLTWTADANLRGNGWSLWGAFLGNTIYSGGDTARQLGVNGALSLGAVVQGGVFLIPELELVARWEGLWVQSGFDPATYAPSALNSQTMNIVTVGMNWYFNKNALKFALDGGYAFNPVLFQNGLFGENIGGADWRSSATGVGAGEVVVRGQLQLLF